MVIHTLLGTNYLIVLHCINLNKEMQQKMKAEKDTQKQWLNFTNVG